MTSNYREIYNRHRGPFSLVYTRSRSVKIGLPQLKTMLTQKSEHVKGPFSAEDAHEEARMTVNDPRDNVEQVFVFSDTENQFIGAFYKRGETYKSWEEETYEPMDGRHPSSNSERLELLDELETPALLPGGPEPLPTMDAPIDSFMQAHDLPEDRPVRDMPPSEPTNNIANSRTRHQTPRTKTGIPSTKLPGDRFPTVRGRPLVIHDGTWPPSPAAQKVRAFMTDGRHATSAEIVAALGDQLEALGVKHPASLVSRLKQAGLLKETS